jgi:hypothetical protein
MAFSTALVIQCEILRVIVYDELEKYGGKWLWPMVRNCPSICLESYSKIPKYFRVVNPGIKKLTWDLLKSK